MPPEESGHSELVDLSEHCLRISRFLYADATIGSEEEYDRDHHSAEEYWGGVAEPLHIAGSIESISITPAALDPGSGMMCSTAWEYDVAVSDLTAIYLKELTRFMWCWIALEKIADLICGTQGSRSRRIINFLDQQYKVSLDWEEVRDISAEAQSLTPTDLRRRLDSALKKDPNPTYFPIHLCREARNDIFHAHSTDLFPDDETPPHDDGRVRFPRLLCRLTLLIIQQVFTVYYKDSEYKTGQLMPSQGIPSGIFLRQAARNLHFTEVDIRARQMSLL